MVEDQDSLSRALRALAHPVRRELLSAIAEGNRSVTALAASWTMSLAAVSEHLRVLENAGLIRRERRGREFRFRLEKEALQGVARDLEDLLEAAAAPQGAGEEAAPEEELPVNLL